VSLVGDIILRRLENGPLYIRSFQRVKTTLDRLIADGQIERCYPPGGHARNMVRITAAKPAKMTMLDAFAQHLSGHGDIARAAASLGQSHSWGKAQFRKITKALGEQAR